MKRKFESDKRPDKSKIPVAEHKAGCLKRMADRGKDKFNKVTDGIKRQASKFARARGEGVGSNTEA